MSFTRCAPHGVRLSSPGSPTCCTVCATCPCRAVLPKSLLFSQGDVVGQVIVHIDIPLATALPLVSMRLLGQRSLEAACTVSALVRDLITLTLKHAQLSTEHVWR